MFFSPFSIAITSLGEVRANPSAFCTFIRFAFVWFCLFSLPLGDWEGLRFKIAAVPVLFSFFFFCKITSIHNWNFFHSQAHRRKVSLSTCYLDFCSPDQHNLTVFASGVHVGPRHGCFIWDLELRLYQFLLFKTFYMEVFKPSGMSHKHTGDSTVPRPLYIYRFVYSRIPVRFRTFLCSLPKATLPILQFTSTCICTALVSVHLK